MWSLDISTILNMWKSFQKNCSCGRTNCYQNEKYILDGTDITYLYLVKHTFLSSIKMVKMKKPGYYTFQFQSQI